MSELSTEEVKYEDLLKKSVEAADKAFEAAKEALATHYIDDFLKVSEQYRKLAQNIAPY